LYANGPLDRGNVARSQATEAATEALAAHRCDLVRHGLPAFSVERDVRFRGIEVVNAAGEWNHLNPVEHRIGGVIADNDRWTGLADFAAQ